MTLDPIKKSDEGAIQSFGIWSVDATSFTNNTDIHNNDGREGELDTGSVYNFGTSEAIVTLILTGGLAVSTRNIHLEAGQILCFENLPIKKIVAVSGCTSISAAGNLTVYKKTEWYAEMLRRSKVFFRSLTAATSSKLVTPNGSTIKQDANGNIGIYNSASTEYAYFDGTNEGISILFDASHGFLFSAQSTTILALTNLAATAFQNLEINALYLALGVNRYNNIATKGIGLSPIFGLDNRTGLTASDGAPITLYTTTAAGQLYKLTATIDPTVFVLASTYVIKYTENTVVKTITLTTAALNTPVHQSSILIQPDNGTNITVQYTNGAGSTDNVACTVEEMA